MRLCGSCLRPVVLVALKAEPFLQPRDPLILSTGVRARVPRALSRLDAQHFPHELILRAAHRRERGTRGGLGAFSVRGLRPALRAAQPLRRRRAHRAPSCSRTPAAHGRHGHKGEGEHGEAFPPKTWKTIVTGSGLMPSVLLLRNKSSWFSIFSKCHREGGAITAPRSDIYSMGAEGNGQSRRPRDRFPREPAPLVQARPLGPPPPAFPRRVLPPLLLPGGWAPVPSAPAVRAAQRLLALLPPSPHPRASQPRLTPVPMSDRLLGLRGQKGPFSVPQAGHGLWSRRPCPRDSCPQECCELRT